MRTLMFLFLIAASSIANFAISDSTLPATRTAQAATKITLFTKFARLNNVPCTVQLVAWEEKPASKIGELPSFAVELLKTDVDGRAAPVVLGRSTADGVTGGMYVADAVVDESASTVYLVQSAGRRFSIVSVSTDGVDAGRKALSVAKYADLPYPATDIDLSLEEGQLIVNATVRVAGERLACLRFVYSLQEKVWKHKDELILREGELFPKLKVRVQ